MKVKDVVVGKKYYYDNGFIVTVIGTPSPYNEVHVKFPDGFFYMINSDYMTEMFDPNDILKDLLCLK